MFLLWHTLGRVSGRSYRTWIIVLLQTAILGVSCILNVCTMIPRFFSAKDKQSAGLCWMYSDASNAAYSLETHAIGQRWRQYKCAIIIAHG